MVTLQPAPIFTHFNPGRFAANRQKDDPSDSQKTAAQRRLEGGISAQTWHIVDILATTGLCSSHHLPTSTRTLQRLAQQRILERLVRDQHELRHHFTLLGIDVGEHPVLYTLGPVGIDLARERHKSIPSTSHYLSCTTEHLMHDLLVHEIVLRLGKTLGAEGWHVEWLGSHESELTDKAQQQIILTPNALIRFRKNEDERTFLLEYHHEDRQASAHQKVERFEAAAQTSHWKESWEVAQFPNVLVVFKSPIIGTGYKAAISSQQVKCTYYGKTLKAVLEGKLTEWTNIENGHKELLWPQK